MPRLPKGMKRRRKAFYMRRIKQGKEVWIPLGSDYTLACKKLKELKHKPVRVSAGNVAELANVWLETYVATARNEKNQKLARQRVQDFLANHFGKQAIDRVTAADLCHYRLWLEKKGLAVQTVLHVLSDARCFFGWAVEAGYIEASPFPKRLMPRVQERPPSRLSDREVGRLLAMPEPWAFVIRLGLGTGLRWGELVRADAAHVENGMLVVSQTKNRRVRRIPLSPDLLAELKDRVGRLMPTQDSTGFARRVRRLSGVYEFRAHRLRHTFACTWLERGGSLAALQEILGHRSIETTQRYARLLDDHIRAEAERIYA